MKTLKDVWKRIKAHFDTVVKGKDPKVVSAIGQYTPIFLKSLNEMEKIFQDRDKLLVKLKTSTAVVITTTLTLKQKLAAAKLGNEDLDDRLDELLNRMKDLSKYGFENQWD